MTRWPDALAAATVLLAAACATPAPAASTAAPAASAAVTSAPSAAATPAARSPTAAPAGSAAPSAPSAASTTVAPATAAPPAPAVPSTPAPPWTASEPPKGATVAGAQWVRFPGPGGTQMSAAVFRPAGAGPFPAAIFLHGTEGFRSTHELQLAADVAASGGLVTVAACWFAGNWNGAGANAQGPIPFSYPDGIGCPDAPPFQTDAAGSAAQAALGAVVDMARTLPGVDARRVGLVGHSRGGVAAVAYGFKNAGVLGVVAEAGYAVPGLGVTRTPVLVLQGTADEQVPANSARAFETAARFLGIPVESRYYDGAGHDLFYVAPMHADVVARIAAFFAKLAG